MTKKELPVYNIEDFKHFNSENEFYSNVLPDHLKNHHFIHTPHKHDFFLVVLFTHGSGTHEIDFINYKVVPGAIFLLRPGQTHNWKLSKDIDGYVFFHSKQFYDSRSISQNIQDYPFFSSIHNPPLINIKDNSRQKFEALFSEIKKEFEADNLLKAQKLHTLVTLAYIDLTRLYPPAKQIGSQLYLSKLKELENLIDLNYKALKYPNQYAELMAISEKHLNRICKSCLNKTTTDLITDKIILEAKRALTHSQLTINQISESLGYMDVSYFSRLFKKRSGETASSFLKKNRH
ncbi:MAG: helix-turn-helix domain-containing protein [Bacteroidetes bacterium]|nr:helix-turn-helix domain-containing protein [Bacteroidota bacterium]